MAIPINLHMYNNIFIDNFCPINRYVIVYNGIWLAILLVCNTKHKLKQQQNKE